MNSNGFHYKIKGDIAPPCKIKGGHRFYLPKDRSYWLDVFCLPSKKECGLSRVFLVKPETGGNDRLDIKTDGGMRIIMGGTFKAHITFRFVNPKKQDNSIVQVGIASHGLFGKNLLGGGL